MPGVVISSADLQKRFRSGTSFTDMLKGRFVGRRIDALRGVSFEVARGEIVSVMGANGAGKSTLLRLVAGLLLPDGGHLEVLGRDVSCVGHQFRRRVCFVNCDERSFSWRLTGKQNLDFFAALYELRGAAARRRVERALHLSGLEDEAPRPVREYSTGMRQRLALARGLLGDPEIFLFDEPTRGVDPVSAARLRRFIRREVVGEEHTAIVATHSFSDVAGLCDRVLVLERGRISREGAPGEAARMIGVEPCTGSGEAP